MKMDRNVKDAKRKFDAKLRHLKAILLNHKKTMSIDEWLLLIDETRKYMLNDPEHFLGEELPNKKITHQAIKMVFEGFLTDVRIREVQDFRNSHRPML